MAVECSPSELMADARCWLSSGQTDLYDRLEILLLCRISQGIVMAECSPSALISDAYCLTCTIPREMWPAVKLALLCSIASGGGGLGGITSGVVDPVAAPTGSSALYYRTDTGTLWMWNGVAWVALLS